jgi:hypothetical protein
MSKNHLRVHFYSFARMKKIYWERILKNFKSIKMAGKAAHWPLSPPFFLSATLPATGWGPSRVQTTFLRTA